MANLADDLRRLTTMALSPRATGAPPPDFAGAVEKARAAQARAAEAPDDEGRARALLEAWSEVAAGLVAWDETRPRPPLEPADTLPNLPARTPGNRWAGLGQALAALARRVRRKAEASR